MLVAGIRGGFLKIRTVRTVLRTSHIDGGRSSGFLAINNLNKLVNSVLMFSLATGGEGIAADKCLFKSSLGLLPVYGGFTCH